MIEIDSVDVDVENLYLSRIKNYIKHSFVHTVYIIQTPNGGKPPFPTISPSPSITHRIQPSHQILREIFETT